MNSGPIDQQGFLYWQYKIDIYNTAQFSYEKFDQDLWVVKFDIGKLKKSFTYSVQSVLDSVTNLIKLPCGQL